MRKKITLLVFFVFCMQVLWSQNISLHDGMYTKKWEEERDLCNNRDLYKKKSFYTPVNVNMVRNGIRIERSSTPSSESSRTKTVTSVKSGRKNYSVGTHSNNKSHYGELRQQWAEEAKRKAEEKKRRIAAENAADRQMGFMRHTAMMSGFYSHKYARDHYLMNEGARRLDESVHAMDFANVPEQRVEVMKGKELADILKNNELQYKEMQVLKKDRQFKMGDKLNVMDNLNMDESILEKWDLAKVRVGIVDVKDKKTLKILKQPEVLVSKEEFCLDSVNLFVLPQYGLVMQMGDSMMVLKDYELRAITLSDEKIYSYIVPCGDKLIGRDFKSIYEIKQSDSEKILEFDTQNFSLFAYNDSSVYCVFWYGGISSIFNVNVKKRMYNEVARLPDFVWKVETNGEETFVMIDNTIFLLDTQGTPHMFYISEEYINDVVLSPWGVLVATDKEVVLIKSAHESGVLYPVAAKHLWCDGNEIYIQNKEGDLLYMENGADYITD